MTRRPERRRRSAAPPAATPMIEPVPAPVPVPPPTLARVLRAGLLGTLRWGTGRLAPLWARWSPVQQLWILRGLAVLVVAWALLTTWRPPAPRTVPPTPAAVVTTATPAAVPGLPTPLDTIQAYNAASITGDVALMGQLVDPAGPLWAEIQAEHTRQVAAGETATSTLDRWGLLAEATTAQTATLDLYEAWTTITRRGGQIVRTDRNVLVQNRYRLVRAPVGATPGVAWWIQAIDTALISQ